MDVKPIDDQLVIYDGARQRTTALKNLWRGCAAFLVCGGPSVKALPYQKLGERGVCSLGINNVSAMVPVKAFTANDPPEKFHTSIWRDPGIMKFCPRPKLSFGKRGKTREKLPDGSFKYLDKKTPDFPNVWGYERCEHYVPEEFFTCLNDVTDKQGNLVERVPAATIGNNEKGVARTGRAKIICTMFAGIRILHYLGVRRVYLLGVDFWMDSKLADVKLGNYAFDELRDKGAINACNGIFTVASQMFVELRPIFEAAGFGVFNCNAWSRLRAFDYVPFDQALEDCRNGIPAEPADLQGWYEKGERDGKPSSAQPIA